MTQQEINNASMLKVGTILHGTYRIDRYLSSGGFGNTYVATNIEFDERVAIKEFFMKGVTQRDDNQTTVSVSNSENTNSFLEQKEKFKKEARRLRKMQNEHLVRVHDLFDENGTTYYVMDYVDGENLSEWLKRTGRPMTESEVRLILPQILDALKAVHNEGFCHLDIKPSNIMLEKGGKIKLIDFGASKQLGANGTLTTNAPTAFAQTPGYAPREQTEQNLNKIGPWTDIYALGATLYNLLTNKRPPLPTDIDDDISEDKHLALPMPADISKQMKDLVLGLMQTNRLRRPQSIAEVQKRISSNKPELQPQSLKTDTKVGKDEVTVVAGEGTIIGTPPKKPVPEKNPIPPRQPKGPEKNEEPSDSNPLAFIVGGLFIFFVIIFSVAMWRSNGEVEEESPLEPNIEKQVKEVKEARVVTPLGVCTYTGPIDDEDKPNGVGTAVFDDGRYYDGPFEHGNLSGNDAYFKYDGGDEFKGSFLDNSFYYGTYTMAKDKSHFTGYFNKGKPYNGKWFDKSGRLIETILP